MISKIKCEHPVFMVNPQAPFLFRRGYDYVLTPNRSFELTESAFVYDDDFNERLSITGLTDIFLYYELLPIYQNRINNSNYGTLPIDGTFFDTPRLYRNNPNDVSCYNKYRSYYFSVYSITEDDLPLYLLVNRSTGDTAPLYVAFPCGRCTLCKKHSTDIVSTRCLLEASSQSQKPFFVTLTFNDKYLPTDTSLPVQVDLLQKFFKRLRKRISNYYNGVYPTNFKYFAVSEFGHLHGRLHFHIVFFNVAPGLYCSARNVDKNSNYTFVTAFENLVYLAWSRYVLDDNDKPHYYSFGHVDCQLQSDPSSNYLLKYLQKHNSDPLKLTKSWKSINLGKGVIEQYAHDILTRYNQKNFEILSLQNSKTVKIPMYAFIKRTVFPPLSRSITLPVRRLLETACNMFCYLSSQNKPIDSKLEKKHISLIPLYDALGFLPTNYDNVQLLKRTRLSLSLYTGSFNDYLQDTFDLLPDFVFDSKTLIYHNKLYQESILCTNDDTYDVDLLAYNTSIETNNLIYGGHDNQ